MNSLNKLKLLAVAAGATMSMGISGAYAAPFAYTQTAEFQCDTLVEANTNQQQGGNVNNDVACTSTKLSWYAARDEEDRSSLELKAFSSSDTFVDAVDGDGTFPDSLASITPNGNTVVGVVLTHTNRVQPFTDPDGNGPLTFADDTYEFSVDIVGSIDLSDLGPIGAVTPAPGNVFPDVQTYGLSFTETFNGGTCPAPNPNGSVCDDIYVLTVTATNFDDIPFTGADGKEYVLKLALAAGDGVAVIPGPGLDQISVYTAEQETSKIYVTYRIVEVSVPEPGMLLLFSGMLVAGAAVARKQKK